MIDSLIAQMRFAGSLSLPVVVGIALVAVLAVLALYTRETKTLPQPYSFLLPALRATAVFLTVLILAGPVWHHRQVVGTLGRVVFAVDTSGSMALSDSQNSSDKDSRLQRASDLLLGTATTPGWLETISETHSIDVVTFDQGSPTLLWSSDSETDRPATFQWSAEGKSTDLSAPLSSVLETINLSSDGSGQESTASDEENDSIRRAAVVLMTDGRDTSTGLQKGTSTAIAQRLSKLGTTVNTLGLGSADEPPGVGIVRVIRQETVAAEATLAGELLIKQYGVDGQPIRLRIESQGQTVWEESITMNQAGQQSIPFEIDIAKLVKTLEEQTPHGLRRLNEVLDFVAKVETDGNDVYAGDDARDFRVAAAKRNRRLLIVDSSSRWETRYLKNLFVRDPSWECDVVLFGPQTHHPTIERGDTPDTFPATDAGMGRYDAILMGEVDAGQFTEEDRLRIARFVASGGGLVIIDGRHGELRKLAETPLGEVFPVRYTGPAKESPMTLRPTTAGLEEPVLGLIDDNQQLNTLWKSLPKPHWTASVELAQGAETWVEAGDGEADSARKTPWLATRMYGAGRVFYLASDQSWRWRYKVADRFYGRFWNQLIQAVVQPPYSASDQFLAVGTDKIEYESGESVLLRARLRDTRGNPVTDSTVDALVVHQGNTIATVPMSLENVDRGTYTTMIPPLPDGDYSIRVRASGYDESALLADAPIRVRQTNHAEMDRVSLNEDSLRQIAEAGNGIYVHQSDAQSLIEYLKPLSSGTIIESDTVLWQSFYWFIPIILLLALEWWLRKRAGLV